MWLWPNCRSPKHRHVDHGLRILGLMFAANDVRLQAAFPVQIWHTAQFALVQKDAGIVAPIAAPKDELFRVVGKDACQTEHVAFDIELELRVFFL